jgi:LPS-assembly protein
MRPAALSALFSLLLCSVSHAGGVTVESEMLQQDEGVYTLTGSVEIRREEAAVYGDRVVYDENTGAATAEGNVIYEDQHVKIRSENAEINLKSKEGVLYDSYMFIKADAFHVWSPEVHKTGEDRYFLKKARATTCDSTLPAWCLAGSDVDIVLGERLRAWHATFRARELPVFYFPYVWISIEDERSTGFLSPDVGYRSSMGVTYGQPFFWAISENRDATFTLDVYGDRGIGESMEYRYLERPGTSGQMSLKHIGDHDLDKDYYEYRSRQRWGFGFLDINLINYKDFYREYGSHLSGSSLRYLESRAEVYAPVGNARVYLAGRYMQELKEGAPKDAVPQKYPEAGIFVAPWGLGPLVISDVFSAANFQRDDGVEGRRFLMGVTAAHSVGQGITFSQFLSAKAAVYRLNNVEEGEEEDSTNGFYDYSATLQGNFERKYTNLRHTIEPSLSYGYVTRDGESPELFDSTEDVTEGSFGTFTLMNRLRDEAGQFLTIKLSQAYDFEAEADTDADVGERPFEPLELDVSFTRPLSLGATLQYDTYDNRVETSTYSVGFTLKSTSVAASQTYTESTDINTYSLSVRQAVTSRLALEGSASYDEEEEEGLEELALNVIYQSQCWGVTLSMVDTPEDFEVYIAINLLGMGSYKTSAYSTGEAEVEGE